MDDFDDYSCEEFYWNDAEEWEKDQLVQDQDQDCFLDAYFK